MTLMGEFLKTAERAKPPGSNQHRKVDRSQTGTDAPPTLAESGITKRESSDAQALAKIKN